MEDTERYPNKNLRPTQYEALIDPDPFSVFLGIASFMGSVASIAGYIEFRKHMRDENNETRFKNLREAKDLMMSLEVDVMQIEASLRKLEFVLDQGTAEQHTTPPLGALKLQFGTAKPIFTLQGFNKYDEIMLEINRLVGKSFETISRLLQRLYHLDIQFGKDTYDRLIELQNKLNGVLREQPSYLEGFRIYYEIIAFTKDLLWGMRTRLSKEM